MGKRGSENRNSSGRRDLARFVLMMLPGFMFVGLLAPAAVSVKPKAEQRSEPVPVSFRSFTPRAPMQLARTVEETRELTASIEVESLFSGARYVASDAEREIALPAVEAGAESGEEIVLAREDAVDDYVDDAMLDDSMDEPALSVDLTALWDPAIFERIPGPFSTGGYTQYDDFHAGGTRFIRGTAVVPIPEPETGALVAVGLMLLALRARSR